jgi:microcystin-dependent protein
MEQVQKCSKTSDGIYDRVYARDFAALFKKVLLYRMTSYRRINSRTINRDVQQQDNMVVFNKPISRSIYPNYFSVPDASNTSLLVSTGSPYSATASPQLTFDGTTLNVDGNVNVTGNYYLNNYILIPAGSIIQSAAINVPNGWLDCSGQSLLVADQPHLFAAIGYTYGGSGLHFNVPDMRGRVGIGAGAGAGLTSRTLGTHGGEETHNLTAGEMPSHTHNIDRSSNPDEAACDSSPTPDAHAADSRACTTDRGLVAGGFNTYSAGSDIAHNNMQPFLVLRYFIKY